MLDPSVDNSEVALPKKPSVGEIYSIRLRDGSLAYVQVVSVDTFGYLVRVLQGRFQSELGLQELKELVRLPHEYQLFSALTVGYSGDRIRRAGKAEQPYPWDGLLLSPKLARDQTVQAWILTDGHTAIESMPQLLPEYREKYPIWVLGDFDFTADVLLASSRGGMYSDEIDEWRRRSSSLEADETQARATEETGNVHFAEFSTAKGADASAVLLGELGYFTEIEVFNDPQIWYLVATKPGGTPSTLNVEWDEIAPIVEVNGGIYDGWESMVPDSK